MSLFRRGNLLFAERIEQALSQLPPESKQDLARRATATGSHRAGFKGHLGHLLGLSPSALSKLLSGQTRKPELRERLAQLLHVPLGWLEGDDRQIPDWLRDPLDLFYRFAADLRAAWAERLGRNPESVFPQQSVNPDDHWSRQIQARIPLDEWNDAARSLHMSDLERLARLLGCAWSSCPLEELLALAKHLGVRVSPWPERLQRGYDMMIQAQAAQERVLRRERDQAGRLLASSDLGNNTLALARTLCQEAKLTPLQRQQLLNLTELIYRQGIHSSGQSLPLEPPAALQALTHHQSWTALDLLR